ncbi:hypothetical protein [Streptomyces sp. NPDC055709]
MSAAGGMVPAAADQADQRVQLWRPMAGGLGAYLDLQAADVPGPLADLSTMRRAEAIDEKALGVVEQRFGRRTLSEG